jgi:hypothetical protein
MSAKHSTKRGKFKHFIPLAAEMYQSGKNLREIGLHFNSSAMTVRKWLIRAGVVMRQRGYGQNPTVRHAYFREIDTDTKAWLLGFIGSDGSVSQKLLRITLHSQDREILERIRDLLAPNHPVRDREHSGGRSNRVTIQSGLLIHSTEMVRDLAKHGIIPRKSLVYQPWKGPSHLMAAYWRGMIDGDGSWSRRKKFNRWQVSLCGTKEIVCAFAEFANENARATVTTFQRNTIWSASCGGTAGCQRIARVLYDGAEIFLARKREKVRELLAVPVQEFRCWDHLKTEDLLRMRNECRSWQKVADRLGTSASNLEHIRRRRGLPSERQITPR